MEHNLRSVSGYFLTIGLILMGISLARHFAGFHDPRLSGWGLITLCGVIATLVGAIHSQGLAVILR